jgi:hypothetical protein
VRPLRPLAASRTIRWCELRGSIPYSAVIHPESSPIRNLGTPLSTVAEHNTRVPPMSIIADPSALRR